MPNGDIPSWEEWNEQLTGEQRDYSLYKTLSSLDKRLSNLENRKWKSGIIQFGGALVGGFVAVMAFGKAFIRG